MAKETLGKSAKLDTQIAAGLTMAGLSSDQGLQSIQQVLQGATDPAQAIAHVVFMAIEKVKNKLEQQGMAVDDRVWMASGGVLDRVLFEIVGLLYGVIGFEQAADPKFVASLKQAIVDLMSQADTDAGVSEEVGETTPDDEETEGEMPQGGAPRGLLSAGGMPPNGGM